MSTELDVLKKRLLDEMASGVVVRDPRALDRLEAATEAVPSVVMD